MNTQTLWQTVLSDLELQVTRAVFKTWLSGTILLSLDDHTATIGCKNPLSLNVVEKRYGDLVKKTLDSYTKQDNKVIFTAKIPTEKKRIDAPLFTMPIPNREKEEAFSKVKLNPDYTYENFAVSSSNQMAYAAATAVSESPGTSYNPLFLYGGVGVGKTHLMQAIAHKILQQAPKTKIIFCTSEEFTNEIIEAIRNKTTMMFRKKYRQQDVLLIDDIQFIAGKNSVQEEFFHTFNAVFGSKGQIILTSDKPPEEINKLEERLRSRFEGGLTIDIGLPDFELRTAILLIKIKQKGVDFPIEAAKLLAANIDDTRKLEGIFVRVLTEAQTKNATVDYEFVKNILGKTIKEIPKKTSVTPNEVINAVATYYNLKLNQLRGDRRDKFLAQPRQILYFLLKTELGLPLTEIGQTIGGRDHSTVLYGVRKIEELVSTDEKIRVDILGIKSRLFG